MERGVNIHQIRLNQLWIGNAADVRSPHQIFELGIHAVVDLAREELPAQLPRGLIYARFPLNDGGDNTPAVIKNCLQFVINLIASEVPTLVACSAGMSRSPTIAAFALARNFSKPPQEMLAEVGNHASLEIHPVFWGDVTAVYSQLAAS